MKHVYKFFLLLYFFSVSAYADTYNTYQNARFNYQIDYPTFLTPQGESENSDGQVIKDKSAELSVWGSYLPEQINEAFKTALTDLKGFRLWHIVKKKDSFEISGENNSQIVFFKTIFICNENINMRLYYPKADKAKWSQIVNKISQSFKYASKTCRKEQ